MGSRRSNKLYTLKIVLITSLFWVLSYSIFILYFAGPTCNGEACDTINNIHSEVVTKPPGFLNKIFGIGNGKDMPGDHGKAVVVPKEMKAKAKEQFSINQFNLVASDLMSLNRSLPDYRMSECRGKIYLKNLPTTAVVIVFHNEAWSTLLRTVHSVINRSPPHLLKEVIMVDDASDREHLGKKLDDYCASLTLPVRVLRMESRTGLIRARLRGAANATADTITFLDAHCEATPGWLEPLLHEIKINRRSVVCPIIDVISDDTFEYITESDLTWGGFNWKMSFRWYPVPPRENARRHNDRSKPLRTPTMAGGLFTINRKYFYEIGAYDPGMDIWGGENLEMSFRVWQCHGQLLIATCSRVGHVFRKTSPYSWPGGVSNILNKNNMRTATVWMDDYRKFFFNVNPGVLKTNYGDVSPRQALRKRLKCHDFKWYLQHIYPESQIPADYFSLGEIRNTASSRCLDGMNRKSGEKLGLFACHGQGGNQVFAYTSRLSIQQDDLCLDVSSPSGPIKFVQCHNLGGNQRFIYDIRTRQLKHPASNQCVGAPSANNEPRIAPCIGAPSQKWEIGNLDLAAYKKQMKL